MHAALKLQCGRVTGNKKFTIGGLTVNNKIHTINKDIMYINKDTTTYYCIRMLIKTLSRSLVWISQTIKTTVITLWLQGNYETR